MTPSRITLNISVSSAPCSRFITKPGCSRFTRTGTCPTARMVAKACATASSLVKGAGTISTTGIRCGGVAGCATSTRPRPGSCSAKRDAPMDDVELARIASAPARRSRSAKSAVACWVADMAAV